ncbi:MAG: YHS domain-containing (seleno)protein [Pseudomonadales bacterium]
MLNRSLLLTLFMAISGPLLAADKINTTFFGNKAIEGYDPVAYFQQDKAVEGKKNIKHEWMGANWHFSSEANRDLFAANPEKYAPQYGGYCAYAVSQNSTAGIEPDQFTIINDKLYLNYNAKIQKKWTAKRDEYISAADKNWPSVIE